MWCSLMESIFPRAHSNDPNNIIFIIHIFLIFHICEYVCSYASAVSFGFRAALDSHFWQSCHYYVTPTEPSNPVACPQGQPCHTLDYYFTHREEYFNSSKRNVTVLLFGREQVLSPNNTECGLLYYGTFLNTCAQWHVIQDLEVFEMIGIKPAQNVILQLFTNIKLLNVSKSLFVNLTIAAYQENFYCISTWMCRVRKL